MRRGLSGLVGLAAGLMLASTPAAQSPESHLLQIDTPDPAYEYLPVRITDRSTASIYTFDPENGETATISYRLTREGLIRVRIVRRDDPRWVLRTLLDWTLQPFGAHRLVWDGRDASGRIVDNRLAFVTFEGDDPAHVAHDRRDCHDLRVELVAPRQDGAVTDLSQVRLRIVGDAPYVTEAGLRLRVYLGDEQAFGVDLDPQARELSLPSRPLEYGRQVLQVNVDDRAGHVGAASLSLRYAGRVGGQWRGRELYGREGCAACHDLNNAVWRPEGPGLRFIGSRRPVDYLRRVIEDPMSLNATSQMPASRLAPEENELLVEYMLSLVRPLGRPRFGERIYVEEGCADCHEGAADPAAPMLGPFLYGIGRLRTVEYLENVILRPQDGFPRTAMPPTVLDAAELAALIEYLREI